MRRKPSLILIAFLILPVFISKAGEGPTSPIRCLRFQIRDCAPPPGKFLWYALLENASEQEQTTKFQVILRDAQGKKIKKLLTHSFRINPGEKEIFRSRKMIFISPEDSSRWASTDVFPLGHPEDCTAWPHSPGGDVIDFKLE